jgi:phosphopentomutase
LQEESAGKDTIVGHWELAGLVSKKPFATFPDGFPLEIIDIFRQITGLEPLGNEAASGTEIIQRLGEVHCLTGRPIVYTSIDSVFQIAAHENIIPLSELYNICRKTRKILDEFRVARVIARPFKGSVSGNFERTSGRHDFTMPPPAPTLLDLLFEKGFQVFGVGKIRDIFAGRGLTDYVYAADNQDGMNKTLSALEQVEEGLIFTNLVDFDMYFGHRRDAPGFGRALEAFDLWLQEFMANLKADDLLVITADHGCDPTATGTDHTRELVPILAYRPREQKGENLGKGYFSDVADLIGKALGLERL